MSFLQQRIPSIRSQLVPVDVDFDVFNDKLIRFVMDMIQNEVLADNQNLEIEVKLGAFFSRDQNNLHFQDTLQYFKMISAFNHTILNDCQPNYMFAPCFTFYPWSNMVFDSTPHPQPFQHLQWYLEKLYKPPQAGYKHEQQVVRDYVDPNRDQVLNPPTQSLRLDIHFASGERASVLLDAHGLSCETIKKRRIGDQDIMKGEQQFRITGQVETTIEKDKDGRSIQQRIINGEPIRQIRFKSGVAIRFQFMRIDLSRVLMLKNEEVVPSIGHVKWQTLLLSLLRTLHDVDEWEQAKVPSQIRQKTRVQESKRKSEVELEIEDLEFIKQYPEPAVKRLIRNVDSFFQIEKVHKDLLVLKIQERHPMESRNAWQAPLIGSYQYTTYQKNHKLKNRNRTQ